MTSAAVCILISINGVWISPWPRLTACETWMKTDSNEQSKTANTTADIIKMTNSGRLVALNLRWEKPECFCWPCHSPSKSWSAVHMCMCTPMIPPWAIVCIRPIFKVYNCVAYAGLWYLSPAIAYSYGTASTSTELISGNDYVTSIKKWCCATFLSVDRAHSESALALRTGWLIQHQYGPIAVHSVITL